MSRPTTPEDVAAKEALMNAYFDKALERVSFVERLAAEGHEIESLTLCVVYLDGLSQLLSWPEKEVGRNFVQTLCSHDQSGYLSLIHPLQLIRAFDSMNRPWTPRARALETRYSGPPYSLMSREDASNAIGETFSSKNEVAEVVRQLWRGTLAAVVYHWMRNPSVHGLGGSPRITFDETNFKDTCPPAISLGTLLPPLKEMLRQARERSLNRCEWFGDDRIVLPTK
jgi:hypothetical protein